MKTKQHPKEYKKTVKNAKTMNTYINALEQTIS